MTTTYIVPYSYQGTLINGSSYIDSERFQLPFPSVLTRTMPVAGGDLFDFNYGQGGKLQAKPFTIRMMINCPSAALLASEFEAFFGLPPTGLYGTTGVFIGREHSTGIQRQCIATLNNVEYTEDADWYEAGKSIIHGMRVTYKPIDLFS